MFTLSRRNPRRVADKELIKAETVTVVASKRFETVRVTIQNDSDVYVLSLSRDDANALGARLIAAVRESATTLGWVSVE